MTGPRPYEGFSWEIKVVFSLGRTRGGGGAERGGGRRGEKVFYSELIVSLQNRMLQIQNKIIWIRIQLQDCDTRIRILLGHKNLNKKI